MGSTDQAQTPMNTFVTVGSIFESDLDEGQNGRCCQFISLIILSEFKNMLQPAIFIIFKIKVLIIIIKTVLTSIKKKEMQFYIRNVALFVMLS